MNELLAKQLDNAAVLVGTLLNRVTDDDERELLQERYEQRLNAELFVGSQRRPGRIVHPPMTVRLRKGLTVVDGNGQESVIYGFTYSRTWAGRKPVNVTWVIVEYAPERRRYMRAEDLRVVETTTAPVNESEASQT